MRSLGLLLVCVMVLAGCASSPGEVGNKVLQDFGLKARDEDYVSGSDRVYEKLPGVAEIEMQRMNQRNRHGEIKYQEEGLRTKYYKEVKRYESFYPLDARHVNRSSAATENNRAYVGYIEYEYQMYRSPQQSTRAEAEAESATVPTGETGRETFRYGFSASGNWNGEDGERARR